MNYTTRKVLVFRAFQFFEPRRSKGCKQQNIKGLTEKITDLMCGMQREYSDWELALISTKGGRCESSQ
jgi:hypothetical protein